jgi:predicted ATPase
MAEELVSLATRHQFVFWLGIAHCLRGWSKLSSGGRAEALTEIHTGLQTWEITGAQLPGTYLRLMLVEAQIANGLLHEAASTIEKGLVQCRTTLEAYQIAEYHRLKAELLARAGDTDAALHEADEAVQTAHGQGAAWMELRAAFSRAHLAGPSVRSSAMKALAAATTVIGEGMDTPLVVQARAQLATFLSTSL